METFIYEHRLLLAGIGAFLVTLLMLTVIYHLRSHISIRSSRRTGSASSDKHDKKLSRSQVEQAIVDTQSYLSISYPTDGPEVYFKLVSTTNMLEALIRLSVKNEGQTPIHVMRINWDLWRTGFHIKAGVFSDKFTVLPGETKELTVREVLHSIEAADYAIGGQSNTNGYLEGVFQCETEFGKFKKSFTLMDLKFNISEDAKLKLVNVMNQNFLDGLTGLLDRKFLENNLQTILNRNNDKTAISFVMIDIDNFKQVNDKHGHLVGDDVIQRVCDIIKKTVGEAGLCIRYGGDEFAVVLQACKIEDAQKLMENIRSQIESTTYAAADVRTTISVGIASTSNPVDYKTLIKNADDVLRVSKENGKNRVTINQRRL